MKQKILFLLAFLLTSVNAFSEGNNYDFESGNLYYKITSESTVMVTFKEDSSTGPQSPYTGSIIVPATVSSGTTTYEVTAIGENAFEHCSGVISISLPSSVTAIGASAFYDCTGLTSVNIPEGVTKLGMWVFRNCSSLTALTLPESLTELGSETFSNCKGLKSLTLKSQTPPTAKSSNGKDLSYYDVFGNINEYTNTDTRIPEDCKLIIPEGDGVELAYRSSSLWSGFYGFKAASISITPSAFELGIGETRNLTATVAPSNTVDNVTWKTGDSGIATVDESGVVTAVSAGSTTITATCGDVSATSTITVPTPQVEVTGITLNKSKLYLRKNGEYQLIATISPEEASNETITWSSSDETIVTVDENGKVTAAEVTEKSTATITATCGAQTATCEVTVYTNEKGKYAFAAVNDDGVTIYYKYSYNYESIEVTNGDEEYVGDVKIPETVTCNNKVYSVTGISYPTFSNCIDLTGIDIPNSVSNINIIYFNGCSNLTSVSLGSGVHRMPKFHDCTSLTSFTVTKAISSIDPDCFDGCSNLKELNIEEGNNRLILYYLCDNYNYNKFAFKDCQIEKLYLGSNITISITDNSIKPDYNLYPFEPFGTNLTSVTISDKVSKINEYLFCNNPNLKEITISSSVTSIGSNAFNSCTGLTSIEIPNSVTSIGSKVFYGCSNLTSVTISNNLTKISQGTFWNCSGLTSIEIPNSVTSIDDIAFCGCSSLNSVTFSNKVTTIGSSAFKGCTALTTVNIPNTVTSIGQNAFSGCSSMTSVDLGNTLTSIGSNAFNGCSSLTSITIPSSVTSIGSNAFNSCTGLTSIEIPNSVTYIGSQAFYGCSSLTSVTIPNKVKKFMRRRSITVLTLKMYIFQKILKQSTTMHLEFVVH